MHDEAERRYRDDPAFHQLVDLMRFTAMEHGFTPYELKQAVYVAALLNEMHALRSPVFVVQRGAITPRAQDPDRASAENRQEESTAGISNSVDAGVIGRTINVPPPHARDGNDSAKGGSQ